MASIFKKVIVEILQYVDQEVAQAEYLRNKEKGLIKETFNIGE